MSVKNGYTNLPKVNTDALAIGGKDVTATAAELNALDGITASVTELNKLDGAGAVVASGTQAAHIADGVAAAGATPTQAEFDAVVTALNAALAALEAFGITAAS